MKKRVTKKIKGVKTLTLQPWDEKKELTEIDKELIKWLFKK